jgi:hypothetical protein
VRLNASRDTLLLLGVLLVVIFLAYQAGAGQVRPELERAPVRSTYVTKPGGWKALYDTLRELGYPVERHRRRPDRELPNGLLVIATPEQPLSVADWEALDAWVVRGNTALLAIDNQLGEWPRKETAPSTAIVGWTDTTTTPVQPGILAGQTLTTRTHLLLKGDRWRPEKSRPHRPLAPLMSDARGPVVAVSPHGRGRYLLCSSPWSFSNSGLLRTGNLETFLTLVSLGGSGGGEPTRVLFDEYHMGYGSGESLLDLITVASRWGLLQLAVAALLLLGVNALRFGRPIPLPPGEGLRFRSEYLSSMAALFRRARATGLVRRKLGEQFLRDLRQALHEPVTTPSDRLLDLAVTRHGVDRAKLQEVLALVTARTDERLPESRALDLARAMHQILQQCRGRGSGERGSEIAK